MMGNLLVGAAGAAGSLFTLFGTIGVKSGQAVSELNNFEKRVDKTAKTFSQRLDSMAKGFSSFGKKMTLGVTVPLIGIGTAAYKSFTDFRKNMAEVSTLLSGTTSEVAARIDTLSRSVKDLSNVTGKPIDDLTAGLYQVVSAFGDSEESMNMLGVASRAAVAGISDTASTIGMISAIIKGYGLDMKDAERVTDMAFQTVKLGETSFGELASSVGKVVPIASALNVKQEELWGTLATLTGVTGGTAEVMTQFSAVLGGFMVPSKDMFEALQKLGHETASVAIREKGFIELLTELYEVVGKDEEAMARLFGRKEAMTAILALMGPQYENLIRKTDAMTDSVGEMNLAYEKVDAVNKHEKALNRVKNLMIEVGEAIATVIEPYIEIASEKIQELTNWFTSLDREQQDNIIRWGLLAIAIGPVSKILGSILSVFVQLKNLGIGAFLGGLIAQLGPIVAAVAAIAGAGFTAYRVGSWGVKTYQDADFLRQQKELGEQRGLISSIWDILRHGQIGGTATSPTGGQALPPTTDTGRKRTFREIEAATGLPKFASGAVVRRPIIAQIGEGVDSEAVIPLTRNVLAEIGRGIAESYEGVAQIVGGEFNIRVEQLQTEEDVLKMRRVIHNAISDDLFARAVRSL